MIARAPFGAPAAPPPETADRFLREIAARVAPDLVAEVHLFPPIRQGGMESGVAVVAASQEPPAPVAEGAEPPAEGVADAVLDAGAPAGAPVEAPSIDEAGTASTVDELGEGSPVVDDAGAIEAAAPVVERESAAEPEPAVSAEPEPATLDEPAAPRRFTVYTAHYRLVLKGPDRGKWEADVVAEADAPLEAVDAVVRGVQRRSGEMAEAERMTGDAFRAAIGWTPPEPPAGPDDRSTEDGASSSRFEDGTPA